MSLWVGNGRQIGNPSVPWTKAPGIGHPQESLCASFQPHCQANTCYLKSIQNPRKHGEQHIVPQYLPSSLPASHKIRSLQRRHWVLRRHGLRSLYPQFTHVNNIMGRHPLLRVAPNYISVLWWFNMPKVVWFISFASTLTFLLIAPEASSYSTIST